MSTTSSPDPGDERPDPRVSTVPLPTEDGGEVVIQQQNVGPGNQVGAGEFKRSDETALHRDPDDAADEQERLEQRAPIDDDQEEHA
ncbi:MAG TPA: hypothetical protein VF065_08390 [Ilumatobacter sp.]